MTRKKGSKNFSEAQRLDMCAIIAPRLKYRDTNEDLLLRLEDKGFDISQDILTELKKRLRDGLKERFKAIGEYELAEEHDYAIQMMKDLMTKMNRSLDVADGESEKARVSSEIRAIQKDLIDYYGSVEVVENVFKYFNEEEKEKEAVAVKRVRKKVEKKQINKPKNQKMMTEF